MDKVGITTTVPAEVIFAAGYVPIDLNNVFIASENPRHLIEEAEMAGYPRNICAWIKGIYSTVLRDPDLRTVIAVTQGDCSNTHALMETLQLAGIRVIPFAFPFDRDYDLLKLQIEKLMDAFGVDWPVVHSAKNHLDEIRRTIHEIDRLSWQENRVRGWHNHLWQVTCSDFEGDPKRYRDRVRAFAAEARHAPVRTEAIRIGYIGVPPIMDDIYDYLEERGARVVFNETQRQFSMPFDTDDLVEQYRLYSYPYGIFYRLEDIEREVRRREIRGIIHYAQSFCFRQIEDLIIRRKLKVPILTVEGDRPGQLDARTRIRIDAFLEMLG
ncbi:MAG: 2-hydroxyacyl-CoA dehydratase [Clostridia bacterium]|nr:2-hydroxyacyl-CoA dehydratase [Clostridia bacterium]MDQ7791524.1 2-hydroxyacyl-CoA dehydratase [Clostridia bacterium]